MASQLEAVLTSPIVRGLQRLSLEVLWDDELVDVARAHGASLNAVAVLVLPNLDMFQTNFGPHGFEVEAELSRVLGRRVERERDPEWFFEP